MIPSHPIPKPPGGDAGRVQPGGRAGGGAARPPLPPRGPGQGPATRGAQGGALIDLIDLLGGRTGGSATKEGKEGSGFVWGLGCLMVS